MAWEQGHNDQAIHTLTVENVMDGNRLIIPQQMLVVGSPVTCPYQVQGRLLNGNEALICTSSHGSCAFQSEIPTIGGRHTDVCVGPETANLPFRATPRYMTTHFGTIAPRSSLCEMVQHVVETRADDLFVLDKSDRPAGIVSATDTLIAKVDELPERDETRTKQNQREEVPRRIDDERRCEAMRDEQLGAGRPQYPDGPCAAEFDADPPRA
jgi:hypothetical protein